MPPGYLVEAPRDRSCLIRRSSVFGARMAWSDRFVATARPAAVGIAEFGSYGRERMSLAVYGTIEEAQAIVARTLVRIVGSTAGEIRLALGGGRTPEPAYARVRDMLLASDVNRSRMTVFVTDDNLRGSNEQMIRRVLYEPL